VLARFFCGVLLKGDFRYDLSHRPSVETRPEFFQSTDLQFRTLKAAIIGGVTNEGSDEQRIFFRLALQTGKNGFNRCGINPFGAWVGTPEKDGSQRNKKQVRGFHSCEVA
jgi:hypothetical protein